MIAEALVVVQYAGIKPLLHWHVWLSRDYQTAMTEFAQWKIRMELLENCSIHLKTINIVEWVKEND